jgi:hypothetical protein
VVVKVVVLLPEANFGTVLQEKFPHNGKHPAKTRGVAFDPKKKFVHRRDATSLKKT